MIVLTAGALLSTEDSMRCSGSCDNFPGEQTTVKVNMHQKLKLEGILVQRSLIPVLLLLIPFILVPAVLSDDLIAARVVGVADGDNIIALTANNKRIIIKLGGIDCPEIGQAFAQEALQFTSDQCLGKTVKYRIFGIDIYNRIIATVYLEDGRELNLEIIKAGFAWHYKRYSTRPDYADAETQARRDGVGLWTGKNPMPPWEWRKQRGNESKGFHLNKGGER